MHREIPRNRPAPVVTDNDRAFHTAGRDQPLDVACDEVCRIGRNPAWLGREIVAAHVWSNHPESGSGQHRDLMPPGKPKLRETVQQNDKRPSAGFDVVQAQPVEVRIAVSDLQEAIRVGHRARRKGVI